MRLEAAARRFDKVRCTDAYTGLFAFNAQLGLYDDNKRDSETSARRLLSTSRNVTLPTRRVVLAGNTRFILGHENPDYVKNGAVRVGIVAEEAPYLATIKTLAESCDLMPGRQAYAGRTWIKNQANADEGSDLTPQVNLFFSVTERVADYSIVSYNGLNYFVRTTNDGTAGFHVVRCDEITEPFEFTGQISGGAWNPVTESWDGDARTIRLLKFRWQSFFEYSSKMAPKYGPEDAQIVISKSVPNVNAGNKITTTDGTWMLASVSDDLGTWVCRATRHG